MEFQYLNRNLSPARLIEAALCRGEGQLTCTGALRVLTGSNTGRRPKDRLIADSPNLNPQILGEQQVPPFLRNALKLYGFGPCPI